MLAEGWGWRRRRAAVGLPGSDLPEPHLAGMKVVEHDAQSLRVSMGLRSRERRDYLRCAAALIDFRLGKRLIVRAEPEGQRSGGPELGGRTRARTWDPMIKSHLF